MSSTADKVDDAIARIAVLEVGFEKIQELLLGITARLPAPPPAPATAQKPPTWAPQGPHGMDYNGTPSPEETVARGGDEWVRKNADGSRSLPGDPFGTTRNTTGELVTPGAPPAPRPLGPPLDRQAQLTNELIDRAEAFDRNRE